MVNVGFVEGVGEFAVEEAVDEKDLAFGREE